MDIYAKDKAIRPILSTGEKINRVSSTTIIRNYNDRVHSTKAYYFYSNDNHINPCKGILPSYSPMCANFEQIPYHPNSTDAWDAPHHRFRFCEHTVDF